VLISQTTDQQLKQRVVSVLR